MSDFESLLKRGITSPAEVAPKAEPAPAFAPAAEAVPAAKEKAAGVREKGRSLRDLSLEGVDLALVPDFCWRGNCENPRLIVVTEAPTVFEMNAESSGRQCVGNDVVGDVDRTEVLQIEIVTAVFG